MFRVSVFRSLRRGAQFLESHRSRFFEIAVWPALLWLALKSVPADVLRDATGLAFLQTGSLANGAVVLFAMAWFRFVIGQGRPAAKMERRKISLTPVLRFVLRSSLIVVGASVLLVPPTMVLALAWIFLTQPAAVTADAASQAVGVAFPLAILMLSPLLIRLYAYYAAVIAGRHDVSPMDAWRWMRGKSLPFVALIVGVLAPAILCLNAVEALGLGFVGYGLVMPVLFASVALATAASARAMADLISPPLFAAIPAE